MMLSNLCAVTLLFLIFAVHNNFARRCLYNRMVDLSDGILNKMDKSIIKNNVSYPPSMYFVSDNRIYGCLCNVMTCIPKCCNYNAVITNLNGCQNTSANLAVTVHQKMKKIRWSSFFILYNLRCPTDTAFLNPAVNPLSKFYIQEDGSLYIWRFDAYRKPIDYCFDYLSANGELTPVAIYCVIPIPKYKTYGMIISMPFLLATFLVYALLPDRNLPAKALMCYVLSLLFAYILLVTIQLNNLLDSASCKTLAFFCYFFFMASFFWMNASCLDIFFTFSGIRGLLGEKKKENRRFMYYSAYAWGVPVLMVGFAAIFTFEKTDNLTWATGIGEGQCWFRNGWPTGIYFYFPIATLLIVNIVLFSITTYKIKRVQRDTKMLKNVDSRKNRKYDNNDKQRFNLYVKLLFAMGINWSMEVISWAIMWRWSNVPEYVWVLTDFCNAVYGVFIFFIFVFKRNIWMMLKKRYLQFTGRPQQAHTLTSVNRTTVSQVSSSEA